MQLKFGSRIFAPRPFTSLVALGLVVLLSSLGRWQLQRAEQRRALFDAFDRGTDATQVIGERTPPLSRYQHMEARGSYDGSRQILIDNMSDVEGHAGYYVITPFALTEGGWLLVNRGWVPVGASRAQLPDVGIEVGERTIRGRSDHLPAPGIQLGQRTPLQPPYPVVASFPTRQEIEKLMPPARWNRSGEVVLLDATQPDGFDRRWQPPGFPPMRNIAYAVQWFGLALALAVIYVVTNLRPSDPQQASG